MTFLGIDPGCVAAAAIIDEDFNVLFAQMLSKDTAQKCLKVISLCEQFAPEFCVIEAVNAFAMGRQSAFNFGYACGALEAALVVSKVRYKLIRPQVWQKSCGFAQKAEKKTETLRLCSQLFPNLVIKKTENHIADALHMSVYSRYLFCGPKIKGKAVE